MVHRISITAFHSQNIFWHLSIRFPLNKSYPRFPPRCLPLIPGITTILPVPSQSPLITAPLLTAALFCAILLTPPALAQNTNPTRDIPITGDRLSGFVLPIEPLAGDIELTALRGWAWTIDDTKRLILQGDVSVRIAHYSFTAPAAAIWINRLPSADGLINQIAIYFDEVNDPAKRSGAIGSRGKQLLITASARGQIKLNTGKLTPSSPPARNPLNRGLRVRGEKRLQNHLRHLAAALNPQEDRDQTIEPITLTQWPQTNTPPPPESFIPFPGGSVTPRDLNLPKTIALPNEESAPPPWLQHPQGAIHFSAENITIESGPDENVILCSGSLLIDYLSTPGSPSPLGGALDDWSQLTLTAQRAVIFTEPGPLREMAGRLDADQIHGIYLEGNVAAAANRDEYTLRAPRMYYDFRTGRAIMLDAVLRTTARSSRGRRIPIYARAEEMRQVAEREWRAKKVRVSTSPFFTPHLALGAERMTITQPPPPPPELGAKGMEGQADSESLPRETHIVSEHNTLRLGGLPVLYWPRFSGTLRDLPLKSFRIGTGDNDGLRLGATLDLYALLGTDAPDGVEGDLLLDGYTNRGAGAGLTFRYDAAALLGGAAGRGTLELYGLSDDGIDRTSTGRELDPDQNFRGVALWEHSQSIGNHWLFQGQISHISDPTFISTWRENDFLRRREYETSAYFKYQNNRTAFTALVDYEINDFISNDYLLASRGYQVDHAPEISYRNYGLKLFGDRITYSQETSITRMRFRFEQSTPAQLGVPIGAFSNLPGVGLNTPISDALFASGLDERYVTRFDSRHEFSWPHSWGAINLVPFVVGRYTDYSEDFRNFSAEADGNRAFGAVGLRLSTQYQHVDNTLENRMLDLHRLRHIIEPSLTLWHGETTVSDEDLPEYDPAVESIANGSVVALGLRNTWQTKRGGPGRWRSVDVLTLDTNLVLNGNDARRESPTPQFFNYRPEYSQLGDHADGSMIWLVSDALAITGTGTWDLDNDRFARASIGAELQHSPVLTTFVEYRSLDASNNDLLDLGWIYRLTPKYRINFAPQWDFRRDELRALTLAITRRFPDFDFRLIIRQDEIRNDTTFAATIQLLDF